MCDLHFIVSYLVFAAQKYLMLPSYLLNVPSLPPQKNLSFCCCVFSIRSKVTESPHFPIRVVNFQYQAWDGGLPREPRVITTQRKP